MRKSACAATLALGAILAVPANGSAIYNNLTPNNSMAVASRPGLGTFEIEAADDFFLGTPSTINSASFVGLVIPGVAGGNPTVTSVVIEIYRVFPQDSNTGRTFTVPTRANSPSDLAFDSRDSGPQLSFSTTVLSAAFTASNSVQPGGIHPSPNQNTLGNGPVTGQEVQVNVVFTTPFNLPADHYFFVPQIGLSDGANFYWLSASRPINGSGTTPFPSGVTDLQAWTRDQFLDPDWLRAGTDIVGGATPPTFNLAFSLDGVAAAEPPDTLLLLSGLALVVIGRRGWSRGQLR